LKPAMPGLFHIHFNSTLITTLLLNTVMYNPCKWGHRHSRSLLGNQTLTHEPNASPPHFANTPLNVILSPMPRSPSGLLDSLIPTKTLWRLTFYPMHATCRAHLIILDFIIQVIFD
jgi:hypothetical protein